MDTAVVSEVLLFRLHVIYSLLLGSVLQPGDGPTDPLQKLEADKEQTDRKSKQPNVFLVLMMPRKSRSKLIVHLHCKVNEHMEPSEAQRSGVNMLKSFVLTSLASFS